MIWVWVLFIVLILFFLALDLGVFHRKSEVISTKSALLWSSIWIGLGLLFGIFIYLGYEKSWLGLGGRVDPVDGVRLDGLAAYIKYITGYLIEKSLSVDNIFVIAVIFSSFAVPAAYQHRVLFWGIIGALIMRGIMIGFGAELVARFHWTLYVFGGFLILTGLRMLFLKDEKTDFKDSWLIRAVRRIVPVSENYDGGKFWTRKTVAGNTVLALTPLALALLVVEMTDLIFAVDSIPAIFAITGDAFIVFASNVFAILGLRSLYFALAGLLGKFRYLKTSLSLILVIVGLKMLFASKLKEVLGEQFNLYLLGVVIVTLGSGILFSVLRREAQIEKK